MNTEQAVPEWPDDSEWITRRRNPLVRALTADVPVWWMLVTCAVSAAVNAVLLRVLGVIRWYDEESETP